ncbi:MAG: ABC transporter substrate-binding protein [Pseudomonadota bacterium]|nr:ABC transporter substrate-binding protein [Pseudomonadota bacterium]
MKSFLVEKNLVVRQGTLGAGLAIIISFLFIFGHPSKVNAEDFSNGAKAFINSITQEAITTLTGKDITKKERARLFRAFMNKHFSIKGIAKFVVGRHLRKASDQEKKQYFKLFEDLMVATYSERFAKYSGEQLLVKKAVMRSKKDVIVHSTMVKVGSSAQPLKVDWRVRSKGEGFTIIDVMVEGISMIMTQKSEFSSFLKSNNGEFNKLLMELKKRVDDSSKNNQVTAK